MKKILLSTATVLACTAAAAQNGAPAEIEAASSETALFMNYNPDIRGQAMGGISTGLEGGAYSVFNNAAAATFSNKFIEAAVSYTPWMNNVGKDTELKTDLFGIGTYFKIGGRSTILVGARYCNMGKTSGMDDDGNPLGELKSKEASVDVGYAFKISQHFSVSVTARWVYDHTGGASAESAFGADVGFMYHTLLGERVTFDAGAALNNIGTKLGGYEMPCRVSVGASAGVRLGEIHLIKVGAEAGQKIYGENGLVAGAGLEYCVWNMVSVRGGYHFGQKKAGSCNYGTVGAGVRLFDMIQADFFYALAEKDSPMENTWGIGVGVRF